MKLLGRDLCTHTHGGLKQRNAKYKNLTILCDFYRLMNIFDNGEGNSRVK